jgi:hypothetical protein
MGRDCIAIHRFSAAIRRIFFEVTSHVEPRSTAQERVDQECFCGLFSAWPRTSGRSTRAGAGQLERYVSAGVCAEERNSQNKTYGVPLGAG